MTSREAYIEKAKPKWTGGMPNWISFKPERK